MGGNAGDKWHCEVGVLMGESIGEERDTTYACFVSLLPPLPDSAASMAASSLCTATEKRRQKLGSWTMVGECFDKLDECKAGCVCGLADVGGDVVRMDESEGRSEGSSDGGVRCDAVLIESKFEVK